MDHTDDSSLPSNYLHRNAKLNELEELVREEGQEQQKLELELTKEKNRSSLLTVLFGLLIVTNLTVMAYIVYLSRRTLSFSEETRAQGFTSSDLIPEKMLLNLFIPMIQNQPGRPSDSCYRIRELPGQWSTA